MECKRCDGGGFAYKHDTVTICRECMTRKLAAMNDYERSCFEDALAEAREAVQESREAMR